MMLSGLSYISKRDGIGGRIKTVPDEFAVEEILTDRTVLEADKPIERDDSCGDFTWFAVQKKHWTTEGAIRRIAKALHVGPRRFSYAGTKDKDSVSTQLISVFQVDKERILALCLKDIKILGAWRCDHKLKLGELLGNRFRIIVREATEDAEESVREIYEELGGAFPNYFGEQRFGTIRCNTHKIGEHIVRGRYNLAAKVFLSDFEGEDNVEAANARRTLRETGNYGRALKEFPRHLRLERSMLAHLERHPKDYVNALRKLPRGIQLLFIHAFQSFLFNILLSERIREGRVVAEFGEYYCGEKLGFPDLRERKGQETRWIVGRIIGYDMQANERESTLLERLDLKLSDFKIKGIPELSSKGTHRLLLSPLKEFSFKEDTFRFMLPAGSYATVALREFLDENKGRGES